MFSTANESTAIINTKLRQTMDDQDRNVVIVALCILAGVAFLALLALLFDPLLFHYDDDDDDDDDDDNFNSLPRWTVEYPGEEAYFQQQREYQRKLKIYNEEQQAYEQQQQQQQQLVAYQQPPQQTEEVDNTPVQREAPSQVQIEPRMAEMLGQEADQDIPDDGESTFSSVESTTASAVQQAKPDTETAMTIFTNVNNSDAASKKVNRRLETSFSAAGSLAPFDESEMPDDESGFLPLSLAKQQPSSPTTSSSSRKEDSKYPIDEDNSLAPQDSNSTSSLPDALESLHDSSHNTSTSEGEEPLSPLIDVVSSEKAAPPVSTVSGNDATFVSPLKHQQAPVPPEMAPPMQTVHKRSQEAKPPTQVNSFKTLIPRYSHKAERQRFIIMNTLILVIIGSITTVLVLRFYI